jgi:hypothetical protein
MPQLREDIEEIFISPDKILKLNLNYFQKRIFQLIRDIE